MFSSIARCYLWGKWVMGTQYLCIISYSCMWNCNWGGERERERGVPRVTQLGKGFSWVLTPAGLLQSLCFFKQFWFKIHCKNIFSSKLSTHIIYVYISRTKVSGNNTWPYYVEHTKSILYCTKGYDLYLVQDTPVSCIASLLCIHFKDISY